MDELVSQFLRSSGPVLCLDIGSGTQKALLARYGQESANWPRFVLPAPERLIAQRIRELTLLKCGIWLYGDNMGGGFRAAIREHLAAGLPITASASAAKAIACDLDLVQCMGLKIRAQCPDGFVPVHLGDYQPDFWNSLLRIASLPLPHLVLAAAQDHSDQPGRDGRMRDWQNFMDKGADPASLLYTSAPARFTRLAALQKNTGGPVADSGICALLGALTEPKLLERSQREGVTVVNVGNMHTLACLIYRKKICGVYEHHTDKRELAHLLSDLDEFRLRWLPNEEVKASGGHGTAFGEHDEGAGGYAPTFLIGPRRNLLKGHGQILDDPHLGCIGFLYGWAQAHNSSKTANQAHGTV